MSAPRRNTIKTVTVAHVDLGEAPPHMYVPTMQVRRKSDGLVMTINRKDFGGKHFAHRDFIALDDRDEDDIQAELTAQQRVEPPRRVVVNSAYTEEELKSNLKAPELKLLPEFARIDEETKKKIRTKGDLVAAILAARVKE